MVSRRLCAGAGAVMATAVLLVALAPGGGAAGSGSPRVRAAVQVTPDPNPVRAHSAPQIARNPRTGELVVVESDPRGTRTCDVHISTDGGRSWFPGGKVMLEPYTDCAFYAEYGAYATMAFARDGTLYVAYVASEHLGRARNATPRHVVLARSADSGRTFAKTLVFEAPDGNQDRGLNKGPMVAVDPNDPGRVYVGWRQGVFSPDAKEKLKTNVAASADGGRTFGPPVDLTDERGGDYPGIAVGPDGTVHAVYWTRAFPPVPSSEPQPVRPIRYARSTDHGRTWSAPEAIDPGNQRAQRPPLLAADPRTGTLYTVWYGHAEAANMRQGFEGDLDVFVRVSPDGGRTWSERAVLNDDGDVRSNQFDPGIAIAPDGRVDVAWYDARFSPRPHDRSSNPAETGLQDVFLASSRDQGRTWSPNQRVSDRSIDRAIGVFANRIDSHFNVGIAATEDETFLAWQDSRNGRPDTQAEDVYAASVGPAERAASSRSLSPWAVLGAGLALGAGAAMALAAAIARRHRS